jgi:hypothetical protein
MAVFVGSNSDDSRIRSNRVGFAASTSNPGSPAEGDAYYNSTDNKLNVYDGSDWAAVGAGGGTIELVASGTLANGQTVIIQSDGTVKAVSGESQSVGSAAVYESANVSGYLAATFDSTNGKVVIAYMDGGNSNHGTAVVGTVSGTSISFGTPVVFAAAQTEYISATFDSTNGKVVITYNDDGNFGSGTAIVGTVSGTSISFGSEAVFNSGQSVSTSTFDSTNGKVIIVFRDGANSNYGTAVVGTISGTSISYGSEAVFESARIDHASAAFDSSNGKVVIAYRDYGNSNYGTAVVGTVSGTSISFGTPVVFNSGGNTVYTSTIFDSTNNKIVIAYRDGGNSNYGAAIVGTVSGTSISFGSAVVFESATSNYISAAYDSNAGKVLIAYQDNDNSQYGTFIVGTVSGTSISFDSPVVYESANASPNAAVFDSSNNKVAISYADAGNSNYGTSIVVQIANTNLTSTNFLGFSDAAYSDGATATIQVAGSVDDAQSGLTTAKTHYVQNDGTLSTTAGSPSVEAGTAVSATQIIVKG